jgi:hypothetical protein
MKPLLVFMLVACAALTAGHIHQSNGVLAIDILTHPMVYSANNADSLLSAQADDPHAGQPDHCSNAHSNTHKCECQRATKCKHEQAKEEDSKCQTYCRKEACKCLDPCAT